MKGNSAAAAVFCGNFIRVDGVNPLGAKEWNTLCGVLSGRGLEPLSLLDFSDKDFKSVAEGELFERLVYLAMNKDKVFSKLAEYESKGIKALTVYDGEYPEKLLKTLGSGSPVVLFSAGDTQISNGEFAGYVGSRNAEKDDLDFARFAVGRTVERGFGVVSGGAHGVDNASEDECLNLGGKVIEFPSDGMLKKLKNQKIAAAVEGGKMLILSLAPPEAGFNLGVAMMRNRFIYAQSSGTVVIRADYNKGGTWSGATDNLKHGWCKQLCRKNSKATGNCALIEMGAIPIDYGFDGDISSLEKPEKPVQLSLF
ncbi:MAG: DNA-processing protein DprA [Clostridia bacterium]|nr:DNA-processing protein DprA [Clostridia bacterium]